MLLRHLRIGYLYIGRSFYRDVDVEIALGLLPRVRLHEGEIAWRISASVSWDWAPPMRWYARTTANGHLGPNEYYAGSWTGLAPVVRRVDWKNLRYWFHFWFNYIPERS